MSTRIHYFQGQESDIYPDEHPSPDKDHLFDWVWLLYAGAVFTLEFLESAWLIVLVKIECSQVRLIDVAWDILRVYRPGHEQVRQVRQLAQ